MDTSVIVSIIIGASSVVASLITSIFFGWIPNRRSQEIEKLKCKVTTLTQDVASFREIENAYISLLAEKTGENKDGLKKRIRKEVRDKTGHLLSNYTMPSQIHKGKEM